MNNAFVRPISIDQVLNASMFAEMESILSATAPLTVTTVTQTMETDALPPVLLKLVLAVSIHLS